MSEVTDPFRRLEAPRPADIPETADAFLRALGGPALIGIPGRDRTRVRAINTLLHGNEPSGIRAIHAFLRKPEIPAVDLLLIVANTEAALAAPGFAHRALPGRADLNRCFLGPFEGREGELAASILAVLREAEPEALVDLHNNTGHNPPYGVGPDAGPACLNLVSLFADRFVHSLLRLGALVEATANEFPSVTIECGRAGDPAADEVALSGLRAFAAFEKLECDVYLDPRLAVLTNPVRVRVRPGIELGFGTECQDGFDLTMRIDIDRHNFEPLAPGLPIGWLGPRGIWPLEAIDASGLDVSRHYFVSREQNLETRHPLTPIMMTTNRDIALGDCLFYVVDASAGE